MVTKAASPLHQGLVQALVEAFIGQRRYNVVAAAVEGYPDPEKVGRHEPDIIAKDDYGAWQIGEAKTGDGDLDEQAKEQFLDFSKYSLHAIVPKSKEEDLREFLRELGLIGRVTIWTRS
ncbi:MAG: hypothetical protein ACOZBZ_00675 [Patescibacteria group bacterium]